MNTSQKREASLAEVIERWRNTIRYIIQKWKLVLMVSFCCGVIGVLFAWLQKPLYVAEMTFTTESESTSRLSAYAGLAAQFGFDLGGGSNNIFEGDNLAELLKSRNLIEKTLLTPAGTGGRLMIDEYITANKIEPREEDGEVKFEINPSNNTRAEDSLLTDVYKKIVKNELEVYKKDKKLSMIILKMKSRDEVFSKRFVELLASNAIKFYTDYKSKKARQNVELLQRQTDSVRAMLFGSITDVAAINDLNVNPLRQSLRTPGQRKQVDVQVNGTLYGELLKNLELAKLALRKETPLIQVIDTPKYPLEKKKLGRLKGGLIFAFVGGFLVVLYLVVRRFYHTIRIQA